MAELLLDASALVALFRREPGAEMVGAALAQASITAPNLAEVLSNRDLPAEAVARAIGMLHLPVLPMTEAEAPLAASLLRAHRGVLSLGDAACLAAAQAHRLPVLTADRAWTGLGLALDIRLIRP
jgi:PIN domain nuclease of toxin-antitoxin system